MRMFFSQNLSTNQTISLKMLLYLKKTMWCWFFKAFFFKYIRWNNGVAYIEPWHIIKPITHASPFQTFDVILISCYAFNFEALISVNSLTFDVYKCIARCFPKSNHQCPQYVLLHFVFPPCHSVVLETFENLNTI